MRRWLWVRIHIWLDGHQSATVIFLATDSAESAHACKRWHGFTCITIDGGTAGTLRSDLSSEASDEIHTRVDIDHAQVALFALADLKTMQEYADIFIGSVQSDFSEDCHMLVRTRTAAADVQPHLTYTRHSLAPPPRFRPALLPSRVPAHFIMGDHQLLASRARARASRSNLS